MLIFLFIIIRSIDGKEPSTGIIVHFVYELIISFSALGYQIKSYPRCVGDCIFQYSC